MAEARKATAAKPDGADAVANGPSDGVRPVHPGGLQSGEAVSQPLTTNPPRGVGELPADHLTDEPGARAVQDYVHEKIAKETAQGFRGDPSHNDNNPNEAYTLRGVGRGDPNPETTVHTPQRKS